MSTIKANTYLDASGGNTATINGLTPISLGTLNASGSAPVFACRAWVNFNGTGTPTIRASGNVSSITDQGVGNYKVNFSTSMQDGNYATIISCSSDGNTNYERVSNALTASVEVRFGQSGVSDIDQTSVYVSIFR